MNGGQDGTAFRGGLKRAFDLTKCRRTVRLTATMGSARPYV
jgi:hypothetical protein